MWNTVYRNFTQYIIAFYLLNHSDLELNVPVDLPVDLHAPVTEDIVRAVSSAKWTRTSYDPVAQFVRTKRFSSRPSLRRDRLAPRPLPKGTSSQNAPYSNVVVDSRAQTGEYMAIEPGSGSDDDDEFGPEMPPGPVVLELSAEAAAQDTASPYENQLVTRPLPSTATTAIDSSQQAASAGEAKSEEEEEVRYSPTPSPPRQPADERTPSEQQAIQVQIHSEGVESSPSPNSESGLPTKPTRSRSDKPPPKRPNPSHGAHPPQHRAQPTNARDEELAEKATSSSLMSLHEGADYELPSS